MTDYDRPAECRSRTRRSRRGDARNVVCSSRSSAAGRSSRPRRAATSSTPSVPDTTSPRSRAIRRAFSLVKEYYGSLGLLCEPNRLALAGTELLQVDRRIRNLPRLQPRCASGHPSPDGFGCGLCLEFPSNSSGNQHAAEKNWQDVLQVDENEVVQRRRIGYRYGTSYPPFGRCPRNRIKPERPFASRAVGGSRPCSPRSPPILKVTLGKFVTGARLEILLKPHSHALASKLDAHVDSPRLPRSG